MRDLVEVLFSLEFFFADAMRFIPVQFSHSNATVLETDSSVPLHLPPVALAIQASEPREITDASSGRNRYDVGDVSDKLEVH